jgi:hypothetical protein
MEELARITSKYFCAGIVLHPFHLTVIDAAPIVKYLKGKSFNEAINYCHKKHWKFEYLFESGWKEI